MRRACLVALEGEEDVLRSRLADGIAVVALVAEQRRSFGHGVEQRLGFQAVVNLAAGQAQVDGPAVSVHKGMNLAREGSANWL